MSKLLIDDSSLTAIADGFRASRGLTESLTLDRMATLAAESVSGEEITPPNDVPSYVKEEAEAVASAVRSVQTGKTLTFAAMSDTHIGMALTSVNADKTRASAEMAGQGLAYLRNILPIHAGFVLGDLTWSDGAYTVQQVKDDWKGSVDRISVGFGGLPSAWTAGNHEINYGVGRERSMTESEINVYIGSNSKGFIRPDGKCCGYIDFPIQKIRVIVINTADTLGEYPESDTTVKAKSEFVGAEQLQWFADTALDFSDKSNATEWGIVICSHHPIAYGGQSGIGRSLQILEAYRDGTSGSITYTSNTTHSVTYDFTSGAKAEIICNIHGHSHNFVYKKRSSTSSTGGDVEPWLWSICVPCINCGRENEQATNDALKDNYGDFNSNGEPVYYEKTAETRNGTSFCVITVDRDNQTVYAHKFGAGVDRTVYYGEEAVVTYSVASSLNNCTISNTTNSIREGQSFSAVITPSTGHEIDSISVTMGGQTVAHVINADGTASITIASVTGDIVITVVCVEKLIYPPTSDQWTNRVLEAKTAVGSTEIYNTVGYMDGKYVSSNGAFGTDAATTATGFIPYSMTSTSAPAIYIKGITLDTSVNSHCRIYFSTASNEHDNNFVISAYGTFETLGDKYYRLTLNNTNGTIDAYTNFGAFVAFRVSGVGTGENLIVTLDEPIGQAQTVAVTNTLTNCTNSNSTTSVETGSAYSATITVDSGYELSAITVIMGGVDITSTAVNGSAITIASVTGDIAITATAVATPVNYTNLVPYATSTVGGTEIYNNVGYMDGKYLSSSNNAWGDDAATTATGFIPITTLKTYAPEIYFKGVTLDATVNSRCRIYFNTAVDKTQTANFLSGSETMNTYCKIETLGTNYYKLTLLKGDNGNLEVYNAWGALPIAFRVSGVGTGENLIVTFDEPIE